ncbi:F-box/LRR-repeat protein 2-like [Anastrepha ludens]|uniref:F-box/LRR-repeat protein 2-like n=1 Tax=Anastrepha ludens TaxID=28586 RepID=UPI0023B06DC7|nr:F-box/LRR-repeat protein 2-like [Anastrepha ludens]
MDFTKLKSNYYFLDDKAYTEDDLLVYNVTAYQLHGKVTEVELLKYFTQFGDVLKVFLMRDKHATGTTEPPIGVVHFAHPIAAAKALQRSCHELQKKRFFVNACESWEQPEAYKGGVDFNARIAALNLNGDLIDFYTPIRTNILQLNDECLEVICLYLPLRDQIRFSRVCRRFRDIFKHTCKCAPKVFNMNQLIGMTLWDIREFFEMAGANIEELIGSVPYNYQERIDFISEMSPKVRRVNLNCNNVESASLLRLLERFHAVTYVELHNFSLNDNAVLALRKLPNLRALVLDQSFELTGKNLNKLYQLHELSLYGCENVQTSHFSDICKCLFNLRSLDIRHCKMLTSRAYNEMVRHCRQLEQLKISCEKEVNYDCVAQLHSLRRLAVHSFGAVRETLFIALSAHKAQQLEQLEISARNCITHERAIYLSRLQQLRNLSCPNNDNLTDECLFEFAERLTLLEELDIKNCRAITNIGLLVLLRRCPHLKRVNVEQCEGVTDDFLYDACDVLRQRRRECEQPVIFHLAGTSVREFVAKEVSNLEVGCLLSFSFAEVSS